MRVNLARQCFSSFWCVFLFVTYQTLLDLAFLGKPTYSLKVVARLEPNWGHKPINRLGEQTDNVTSSDAVILAHKKVGARPKMTTKGPIASRKEHHTQDGRIDYYHWLRDPNWPDVKNEDILNYLKQENKYTDEHLPKDLVEKLFNEMKDRIQKNDRTVPYLDGGYYYYSYIRDDQQYWVHARKAVGSDKEEITLDENELAKGKPYLSIGNFVISPDHKRVAYSADFTGGERYVIHVKEIVSGEIVDCSVDNVIYGNVEWDKSGNGFFYTPSGEFGRADSVRYHEIGRPQEDDKLIYQEKDPTFFIDLQKTKSNDYITLGLASSTVIEYLYIPAASPYHPPEVIHDRSNNHYYTMVHHKDRFFLRINDVSSNFRVVEMKVGDPNKTLKEFVPPSKDKYIQDIYAYENHLVLSNREKGLTKIEIINLENNTFRKIDFEDELYEIFIDQNTFHDSALRYTFSSLKTPKTTFDYDFKTSEQVTKKTQVIPSGFDPSKYVLKRLWAKIDDEISVPISLVYNKDKAKLDGTDPLYLYGYGAYGIALLDNFRPAIFSLVDRGFTYALAHVRGGDELGKSWHEMAQFLNKRNTFTDFIKAAEILIEDKYTGEGKIVISGTSAGGMLIGACVNMRPELYKAAVAHVPFVDVLNTMLDETLPLTPGEFKEWGNPKDREYYQYMKSYSPYDNVTPQRYPHIFVTAGLSDPRVTYWEAAKWVALLRHTKTDDNLLLLKTDMSSGHGGPSGRYDYLKEIALEYAFILGLYEV